MTLSRAQMSGIELSQLERADQSGKKQKYLASPSTRNYVLIYHACSANAPLHVFAMFYPTGSVKLHIVDPATRRQAISRLSETYHDFYKQARDIRQSPIDYPSQREFTPTYHASDSTALKAISRELGLMENKLLTVVISSVKE